MNKMKRNNADGICTITQIQKKERRRRRLKKGTAFVLALAIAVVFPFTGSNSQGSAYAKESSSSTSSTSSLTEGFSTRASEKDEVVYVMLDASGNVQSINVVNVFGGSKITDYGDYTAVKLMTSNGQIENSNGIVRVDAGDMDDDELYYQGTMENLSIPWNISIRTYMDGKEYQPEDIAGMSGKLSIHFKVTKNEDYSGNFFDSHALQVSFSLDTEKCDNIKAADATIARSGQNKQLSYIILPGKGIDTYITADVTDFEMDAVTINGIKLNLDIDVDYTELDEKVDDAKEGVKKLDDGAGEALDASEEIYDATEELADKSDELLDGVTELKDGSAELVDGLTEITDNNEELRDGAYSAFEGICTAVETILNEKLEENDMSSVSLTPENYERVLDDLLEDLDLDVIYDKAYKTAYRKVSQQVDENAEALYAKYALQIYTQQIAEAQQQAQQAAIEAIVAQMTDEQKAQIKAGAIEQMMNSSEVTKQINTALSNASEASSQVEELKDQLDDFDEFYMGVLDYTDAVTDAKDGSEELDENMQTLLDNVIKLKDSAIEFRDKALEFLDGMFDLKDGTEEFLDKISDMKGELHDRVSEMIDEIKGTGILKSFVSKKNTSVDSVQFVIKTQAIEIEEPEVVETETEPQGFLERLIALFK